MDYIGIIKERKIIDGTIYRRYFIDSNGKPVGIPIGITFAKTNNHNCITNNNFESKGNLGFGTCMVSYHDAATQEAALIKVININRSLTKDKTPTSVKADVKRKGKGDDFFSGFDKSDIPVGISIYHRPSHDCVLLSVSFFDDKKFKFVSRQMYVGARSTWRDNFEKVLQKAIELRQSSLTKYNDLTNRETEHA